MAVTCFSMLFTTVASAATLDEAKADLLTALEAVYDAGANVQGVGFTFTNGSNAVSGTIALAITDLTADGLIYNAAVAFSTLLATSGFITTGTTTDNTSLHWWSMIYKWARDNADFAPYAYVVALFTNMLTTAGIIRTDAFTRDRTENSSTSPTATTVTTTVTRTEMAAIRSYGDIANLLPRTNVTTAHRYAITGARVSSGTPRYHYFNSAVTVSSPTTATTQLNNLKAYNDYFFTGLLDTDLTALNETEMNDLVAANAAAVAKVSAFTVMDLMKIFPDYTAAKNFIELCQLYQYYFSVDALVAFADKVNSGDYDKDDVPEMEGIWNVQKPHYDLVAPAVANSSDLLALLATRGLDLDAVNQARATLKYDIEFRTLTLSKEHIDDLYDNYYADDRYDYIDYGSTVLQSLYAEFNSALQILATYPANVVADVFTEGTGYMSDFIADLLYIAEYIDFDVIATDHIAYYNSITYGDFTETSSLDVLAKLNETEARYAADIAAYNAAVATLDPADLDVLYGDFEQTIADVTDRLYRIIATRFTEQVNAAMYAYGGSGIGSVNWANVSDLNRIFKVLNSSEYGTDEENVIYKKLKNTGYLTQETKDDYDSLCTTILNEYIAFLNGNGLLLFAQTELDDTYPTREARSDDTARVEGEDYQVTEQGLLDTIDAIDNLITNDNILGLLGVDGGLADLLNNMISGLYTDATVNSLIYFLYDAVFGAFADIFGNLPSSVDGNSLSYKKNLKEVSNDIKLYIYPDQMAAQITDTRFASAKSTIGSISLNSNVLISSWDGMKNADDTWKVNWGIDAETNSEAKEDRFRAALAEGLTGLAPLVYSIFAETGHNATSKEMVCAASVCKVDINFVFSDNAGYAKTLVPIFELLGIPQDKIPSTTEIKALGTDKDMRGLVDAILDPIIYFIDEIFAKDPLGIILDILPNLAFSLAMDKVPETLAGLNIKLGYNGSAAGSSFSDAFDIDIPGIVNFSDLGLDMTSIDGVLAFVGDLLGISFPSINTGALATLGTMTTQSSKRPSGTRNYIEADRADVLYFLLDYLLGAIKNSPEILDVFLGEGDNSKSAFKTALAELLNLDEEVLAALLAELGIVLMDDGGKTLPDIVNDILANATADTDDAIAAIVELFAPATGDDRYAKKDIDWMYTDYADINEPLPVDFQVQYGKYWTRAKAANVVDNINEYLSNLLKLLGIVNPATGKAYDSVEDLLGSILGNTLYTTDLLETLVTLVSDLLYSLGLDDETLTALLKELGIDLSCWGTFGSALDDSDRDAFAAALAELMEIDDAALAALLAELGINLSDWGTAAAFKGLFKDGDGNRDTFMADIAGLLGLDEATLVALSAEFGIDLMDWSTGATFKDSDRDTFIADIAGLLGLDETTLADLFKELSIDPTTWGKANFKGAFADGDRDAFVAALAELLTPLYPLLECLLIGEDFYAVDGALHIAGYDGYAWGIVPIFEALGAEMLSTDDYKAAVAADPNALITALLNPLLDVLDDIYADPLAQIMDKIGNALYFVMTGGLDASANNLIQAVNVVLDTIRPIYGVTLLPDLKFGLVETFELLIDLLNSALGIEFAVPFEVPDLESLLAGGTMTSSPSANGETAYKVDFDPADLFTVIARLLVKFVFYKDNVIELVNMLLNANVILEASADALISILYAVREYYGPERDDIDYALGIFYEIFYYSKDIIEETNGAIDQINNLWNSITNLVETVLPEDFIEKFKEFLGDNGIIDWDTGLLPSGLIGFFQKIIDFFNKIIDFFKNLFS